MKKNNYKNINLKEDGVFLVKKGALEKIDPPASGYGKQVITWYNNEIVQHEVSYTKK